MSKTRSINLIPRTRLFDSRGWFLKVLASAESQGASRIAEVYIVMAPVGETRGAHYHLIANEWFTVIQGCALALTTDTITGEQFQVNLRADSPQTLFVPAGIAHTFTNVATNQEELWILACSDQIYTPADTVSYE